MTPPVAGLAAEAVDAWRWQAHVEVWLLVGGLVGLAVYALRVVGPKVVAPGAPVIRRSQLAWLALGVVALWLASDWPVHDIAENYLFSVHMVQHMLLTFIVPPALLLATPEWLARLVLGRGRGKQVFVALARPIPAAALFSGFLLLSHWQVIVNTSVDNAVLHYLVHTVLVATAFLLWMPVAGPLPELRISYPAQMLYLFVASIVPTVPAGWFTFAEGAVYSVYDIPERLAGITVTTDQQAAGLIMKTLGGGFLWVVITIRFFQWASRFDHSDRATDHAGPPSELTWDYVEHEFESHPAPPEPPHPAPDTGPGTGP